MPTVISVIGKKNAGKTTVIERLIVELKTRGYKVATVKHHIHYGFSIDEPGKDTWRHAAAGADTVVISSPDRLVMLKSTEKEAYLDEIVASYMNIEDFVITEGYARADTPKVVVAESQDDLRLFQDREIVAIVSNDSVEADFPCFKFDDITGLADAVEGLNA